MRRNREIESSYFLRVEIEIDDLCTCNLLMTQGNPSLQNLMFGGKNQILGKHLQTCVCMCVGFGRFKPKLSQNNFLLREAAKKNGLFGTKSQTCQPTPWI